MLKKFSITKICRYCQEVAIILSEGGSDPAGLVREVFKNAGDGLLLSILAMANSIKSSKEFPFNWSEVWIKTLKKKKDHLKI